MPPIAGITIVVLSVAVVVLLTLFGAALLRASRARRALEVARFRMLDLELVLAEQTDRLRISGELTGLTAASVTLLASEAEAIRHMAISDPEAAARAAEGLVETAKSAVANLRRASDVAHDGEQEALDLQVAPDLDEIPRLGAAALEQGVRVVVDESGDRLPLKPGAELAIFRILQEAIANATRHGGRGTTVTISLRWSDEGVQVLVDDDGIRASARRTGQDPDTAVAQSYTRDDDLAALTDTPYGRGITEMRNRTELFGGVFSATKVPGVGFSVSAIFPALLHHNGIHGVRL